MLANEIFQIQIKIDALAALDVNKFCMRAALELRFECSHAIDLHLHTHILAGLDESVCCVLCAVCKNVLQTVF